jgi:hypothetical protein
LLVVFQKLVLLIDSLIHFHVTSLLQQVLDELLGLFAATADNPRLLFSANLKKHHESARFFQLVFDTYQSLTEKARSRSFLGANDAAAV